ncbi:MAG TPA: 2-oxoglutarate dehydrogenase E1 component [Thermoanaerobaculia bacterium]|nr:2-oxoglutarate dehydrogenase E1 component [Thermoanaerobaculia bacterium]HUM28531.1 2-oxoglutarate dehydrogenase E1 component [Thermoanaerobaculia bacterium]HXK66861.1 2-oxoglutarate dehydrogenase E1 component [Thermoanaerobaculia bacterium]
MSEDSPVPGNRSLAPLASSAYIDDLYRLWKEDEDSVDREWQRFFEGFELAMCPRTCVSGDAADAQSRVTSLIYAYRSQGHLIADLDPLGDNLTTHPDLELDRFGFTSNDLETVFDTGHLGGPKRAALSEIIQILKDTYCRTVAVEYVHIQDIAIRRWIQSEIEPVRNRPRLDNGKKLAILENLIDAEVFESFTQSRYPGHKRFSLEGAESLIPALHSVVELAPELGLEEIVLGMAHRGRLNVLATILDKSYTEIFSEFEDNFLPDQVGGSGDVKYHRGMSSTHVNQQGKRLHIDLVSNPSHLEAVDPVVLGKARGKQRLRGDSDERRRVMPMLIHGDAAFSGQGLVAEILNLSKLKGYKTGGVFHLIVNNQIGFTTSPTEGRSTRYPTEVAKMVEAPIFHVNGDDPEAVVHVMELALKFRQTFRHDVVVNLVCYRRHGHNEADEPAFTQPVLYRKIRNRPSVRKLYTASLMKEGVLTGEQVEAMADEYKSRLQSAFEETRKAARPRDFRAFKDEWSRVQHPFSFESVETGVPHDRLLEIARVLTTVPEEFHLNPKVGRRLPEQLEQVKDKKTVDWALGELLAFGSLLMEGNPVRLSGQDSARGTFSHRHAVWADVQNQERYIPLDHLQPGQPTFCVYNSPLSEAGVLGFDYGYSLVDPQMVVIWEAQFGDFANGAQVIIDQFIVSSLSKWQRASGIVMLLPHGYEGQGPEHSNAYLERYLQACAEENIQVCNLTTPAQYFHALRRQVARPFRRPLIIMAPKSLLRHPLAVSPVDELIHGTFHEIPDDPEPSQKADRLLFCSGKIYYELIQARTRLRAKTTDIFRIEQLYPFHSNRMAEIAARYNRIREVIWVQEESKNRGAWSFIRDHLQSHFPGFPLRYAGRKASASPATGSLKVHLEEQEAIINEALAPSEATKAAGSSTRRKVGRKA